MQKRDLWLLFLLIALIGAYIPETLAKISPQARRKPASAPTPYCAAIRGNGENVAAHWAALARMIEENGLPEKAAGGSSATVSMFFLDSVAGNPAIRRERDPVLKRKKAALLVKSIGAFLTEIARTDEAVSVYQFMKQLKNSSDLKAQFEHLLASAGKNEGKLSSQEIERVFRKYFSLLNPEMVQGLLSSPSFFVGEAQKAFEVFGQFDAVNDKNIFFRPGLVDFKEFALNLGHIADFYQGNTEAETRHALDDFLSACAEKTYRQEWSGSDEGCRRQFSRIVDAYLARGKFADKAVFQPVGKFLPAIPTTALLKGEAVKLFAETKYSYMRGSDRDYGDFHVDFDRDLRFGYWTKEGAKIEAGLAPWIRQGDLKSQKFEAIKPGNWFEVLATSPAEPGLASIQPIPVNTSRSQVLAERQKPVTERWNGLAYRRDALSAGGWSDLHPIPVLKASGCNQVAYFTRIDGETIFGQQVFIRLTGEQKEVPFWDHIGDQNNEGWKVEGVTANSPWNKLYNLGNPSSSLNRALVATDISYCTNWNRYEPFHGEMEAMEKEAYAAPVFIRPGVAERFRVNGNHAPDPEKYPGCLTKGFAN
jgi:hypothetical protein